MRNAVFLLCGAVFGALLHQARATDYDAILGMFTFSDLHLMGVMGAAIATAALGLLLLRRTQASAALGGAIEVHPKPMQRWTLVAGLVFGAGWALAGTCPGTALAQVGEGKFYALATVAGMIAGTYAFGRLHGPPRAAARS